MFKIACSCEASKGHISEEILANFQIFTNFAAWNAAASALGPIVTEDISETILQPNLSITLAGGQISNGKLLDGASPGIYPVFGSLNFGTGLIITRPARAVGGTWDLSQGGAGAGILLRAIFPIGSGQSNAPPLSSPIIDFISNPIVGNKKTPFKGFRGFVSDVAVYRVLYMSADLTGQSELFTLDDLSFVVHVQDLPRPSRKKK